MGVENQGRAGERSSIYLTMGVAAAAVAIIGIAVVVLAALFVPQIQVLMAPTVTVTPRPLTLTPTPTAGIPDTPSPTPRISPTPSATYGADIPNGVDAFQRLRYLTPTPVYYATPHPNVAEAEDAAEAFAKKDYDGAIELARRARANSQGQDLQLLDTFFYEGMAQALRGNYSQARDVLLRGLEVRNDSTMLNAGLGYVYYQLGQLQSSATYNQRAIEQDPNLALPVLTQADVLLARGQPGEALALVSQALARPRLDNNVELITKRGEANLALGNFESAMADARLALYIDPLAEGAHRLAARIEIAHQNYGAAVLALRDYLFYYPGSILGWTLLGEARYGEGNLNLALAAYDQALAADARNREELQAHLSRGNLYLSRGLYPQAFADFDAALEIEESLAARRARAVAAFQTGRFEAAQEDAEAVLAAEPNNAQMRLLLGQTLVMLEAYEEARATLESVVGQGLSASQQALAYEYLARADYHLARAQSPEARDIAPALQAIDRALSLEENGSRHFYRGLIYELAGQPSAGRGGLRVGGDLGQRYDYPFLVDVEDRLREVSSLPTASPGGPEPTPTPRSGS
ncbi:MAG: tetratricopeptide repeat protein [Anaerolineae bacterium]|nr:tetratricopeptide repeat protein [Anaerolineae bacterium]